MADLPQSLELPSWKSVVSHLAALAVATLFVTAGVWKSIDPFTWSRMAEQLLVPVQFSIPLTLLLAVGETFAGVMVLVPRFRRWGAWVASLLLLVFMIYIGINYHALIGRDCSCFPWVKRAVGPMFFVEDAAMLAAAILAGWWARPSISLRSAAVVLGVVAVFAGASYGAAITRQTGTKAPESITVDGKPYSLQHGRIFVFFYDPNCSHCDAAARAMAKLHWKDDVVKIGIPTTMPQFAPAFVRETGMTMLTSLDLAKMKEVFPFGDPPYGVVLENGRETGPVPHYEDVEPAATLRKLGLIE
ncbi:MAG: hypothetical protein LAO79_25480 [Acidobacteriia bacterium]|nr:hypothetical protein [Terriglobia bacterium]